MKLKNGFYRELFDYIRISFGLVLTAVGLDVFLVPNKIAAGGVSGVAVVLYHMFHLPVGLCMLALNAVLFTLGFMVLGKAFGIRTLFASAGLAVLVDLIAWMIPWEQFTDDLLIAVVFGNLLTGIGMAIVFNRNASTGGTDIIAKILNHFANINIGKALLIIDFVIAGAAGVFLRSVDVGMYSLLAVLINCFTIDLFIDTLNVSKEVMIISPKTDQIAKKALKDLDRGGTILPIQGAYSGNPGHMLMMIVRPRQTARLREIVRKIDPDAFMVVSRINQVLGRGFRNIQDPSAEV